jgi:hypothetical protein
MHAPVGEFKQAILIHRSGADLFRRSEDGNGVRQRTAAAGHENRQPQLR